MLALGRALVGGPALLALDEPSLGLAPKLVREVLAIVGELREEGMTVLLVERNVRQALQTADRAYVLGALGQVRQLKIHIRLGRNVRLDDEEIVEALIQLSVYAGWGRALDALRVAHEVFAGEPAKP